MLPGYNIHVMKISAIKQQVKRADRYSIFVDDKYSFSLGEGEILNSGIRIGQEVTKEQLVEFKQESDFGKIYEKTLNLLSFRPRSEWELRDYLKRKKQDSPTTEKILNKLSKNGYVNDRQFAERWVENRRLLKSTSRRRLAQELRQKRISDDVIDEVLAADETDEKQVLKELIERKKNRYPDKLKLMQYLARQGFSYDDIKSELQNKDL